MSHTRMRVRVHLQVSNLFLRDLPSKAQSKYNKEMRNMSLTHCYKNLVNFKTTVHGWTRAWFFAWM